MNIFTCDPKTKTKKCTDSLELDGLVVVRKHDVLQLLDLQFPRATEAILSGAENFPNGFIFKENASEFSHYI